MQHGLSIGHSAEVVQFTPLPPPAPVKPPVNEPALPMSEPALNDAALDATVLEFDDETVADVELTVLDAVTVVELLTVLLAVAPPAPKLPPAPS
jgi:hypothetical protein